MEKASEKMPNKGYFIRQILQNDSAKKFIGQPIIHRICILGGQGPRLLHHRCLRPHRDSSQGINDQISLQGQGQAEGNQHSHSIGTGEKVVFLI